MTDDCSVHSSAACSIQSGSEAASRFGVITHA